LFVVAIDTGEKRRLTSPPAAANAFSGDSNPAFSPDGRTLAFIRSSDFRAELYLLPVSNALEPMGEARQIPLGQPSYAPAWTEDGREIVFGSFRQGLWRIGVSGSASRSAEPARLPFGDNAWYPAISRRGHRLAYSNASPTNVSIWRMAAPGGPGARDVTRARSSDRSLISSTQNDLTPQFSPDGRRIAFVSYRSGNSEVWVCNSDGSSPVQVTSFRGPEVTTPRWSPDGRRIAFIDVAPGKPWRIYLVSAQAGRPEAPLADQHNQMDTTWSPDGSSLVFSYFPGLAIASSRPAAPAAGSGVVGVYTLDLRTHKIVKVPGSEGFWGARLSPNGRYIVGRVLGPGLVLFDFTTQAWVQLVKGAAGFLNWSKDSQYVYYMLRGNEAAIWRVRVSDHRVDQVASLKDVRQTGWRAGVWTGLAPDDSPLVLRDIGTQEIYALDWEGP
jgi:Tol biopolymer transport system component